MLTPFRRKKKADAIEEEPYQGELHFGVDVATDIAKQDEVDGAAAHADTDSHAGDTEEQRRSGNPPDLIPTPKQGGGDDSFIID